MEKYELRKQIDKIVNDDYKSIDDRIDESISLTKSLDFEDDEDALRYDEICFSCLIDMVVKENDPHIHDHVLLQLYVLLAETFVEMKAYRRLKEISRGVLDVIRYDVTPWEAMEDTLPRIIDAVGESVYNHDLYELLLYYLRVAYQTGKLDSEFTGRVRKFLKLRILLDESDWLDRLIDKDFQKALAAILTPDEYLKIILRPQIGHLKKDPVEYTWEWENIYYDMEARLEERFANAPRHLGFCFHYWSVKKEMLEEDYNIKWHTPSQMNPHVMFD